MIDAVRLAQELVCIDTSHGAELAAAELCGDVLERAGARVQLSPLSPGRANLLASVGDTTRSPLVLVGHLDTVPADPRTWRMDPWSGKEASGALYGRGTADMKSGVAALVIALARSAAAWDEERGVLLILTAGEETGCVGAKHVAKTQRPSMGGPMLVAEPTGLSLACGHKGVLWIRATAHGRSAHGSRPDLGQNAITALARAVTRLEDCGLPGTHPDMGDVTVNVGTFIGGTQINLVPDVAKAEIDVRFVPGIEPSALRDQIARIAGKAVAVEIMDTLPPVYTAPGGPLYSMLVSAVREVIGTVSVRQPLTYFTDASILSSSLRAPETLFFGPGDPDSAHVVDESCPIAEIEAAELVYERLLQAWRSAPQTGLLDDR